MSEPVSNAEIEDVLSSIRRLVSGDVEPLQGVDDAPVVEESAAPEPSARLILTPDFRVSEPNGARPEAVEPADDTPDAVVEEAEVIDDAPFEFHHAIQSSEDAPEPEPENANELWHDPDESVEEDTADVEGAQSLENTIAELEAAIGQQGGEWEPDGSDFEEDADAEEVMSEPVHDWVDSTAEEVVLEPASPVEESIDAAVVADTDVTPDDETDDAGVFGGEGSLIDEETLREMVSDIVRQELQGALGERITRNVRKLVRREINRVLAAQDFE